MGPPDNPPNSFEAQKARDNPPHKAPGQPYKFPDKPSDRFGARQNHLETTRKPLGNHSKTTWKPLGNHSETTRNPLKTTRKPLRGKYSRGRGGLQHKSRQSARTTLRTTFRTTPPGQLAGQLFVQKFVPHFVRHFVPRSVRIFMQEGICQSLSMASSVFPTSRPYYVCDTKYSSLSAPRLGNGLDFNPRHCTITHEQQRTTCLHRLGTPASWSTLTTCWCLATRRPSSSPVLLKRVGYLEPGKPQHLGRHI